jgi:hypothetical protein
MRQSKKLQRRFGVTATSQRHFPPVQLKPVTKISQPALENALSALGSANKESCRAGSHLPVALNTRMDPIKHGDEYSSPQPLSKPHKTEKGP